MNGSLCFVGSFFLVLLWKEVGATDVEPDRNEIKPEDIYKRLFQQRRAQHFEAVNSILNFGGYEKQHKMITLLLEKLFVTMTDSRMKLMEAGFSPGDAFPSDEKLRDAFSNVAENTVLFGDLLLRLPDITSDIMKRHQDWEPIIKWGVGFCNESNILETRDTQLLHLMAQELGIIEKDENYINPYKQDAKMTKMVEDIVDEELRAAVKKQQRKKKKEKVKRGPRLSGGRTEL